MAERARWVLYWAPRALAVLVFANLIVLAFDLFEPGDGFWALAPWLLMLAIPATTLVLTVAVALRQGWVGAAVYLVLGLALALLVSALVGIAAGKVPLPALPAWLVGALFLAA